MNENKQCKNIVLYIQAYAAGPMFGNILLENIHIYSTTATDSDQSSYETYCDYPEDIRTYSDYQEDLINRTEFGTCSGEEYSVNLFEDSDADSGLTETLKTHFEDVKKMKTVMTSALEFASIGLSSNHPIEEFQVNASEGVVNVESKYSWLNQKFVDNNIAVVRSEVFSASGDAVVQRKKIYVNSRDIKMNYLRKKYKQSYSEAGYMALIFQVQYQKKVDSIFAKFNEVVGVDFDYLRKSLNSYKTVCSKGAYFEYEMKYERNLDIAGDKPTDFSEKVEGVGERTNLPLQFLPLYAFNFLR